MSACAEAEPFAWGADPELQDDDAEWFICYSDGDCGLKSVTAAMIEVLQVARARRSDVVARDAGVDENVRQYRLRNVLKARLTLSLNRDPTTEETDLCVFYAEKFGVAFCAARNANADMRAASSPDLYDDSQCTLRSNKKRDPNRTHFAKLRRCFVRWQRISDEARRTIAAHYFGLNPDIPKNERDGLRRMFGEFAAAAYWFFEDEALIAASKDEALAKVFRSFIEGEIRSAHREWSRCLS